MTLNLGRLNYTHFDLEQVPLNSFQQDGKVCHRYFLGYIYLGASSDMHTQGPCHIKTNAQNRNISRSCPHRISLWKLKVRLG